MLALTLTQCLVFFACKQNKVPALMLLNSSRGEDREKTKQTYKCLVAVSARNKMKLNKWD